MHWHVGWIVLGIAGALVLVYWVRQAVRNVLAIYRTLRYGDPSEPRKYHIGKRLVSFAGACALIAVFIIDMLLVLFLDVLAVRTPPWVWTVAIIMICLTVISSCVGVAFMLPLEIAQMRREAREARERGEGFWISRHSDG